MKKFPKAKQCRFLIFYSQDHYKNVYQVSFCFEFIPEFNSYLTSLTWLTGLHSNRTPGSSNKEPPAKRIRPQTSTDIRANAKCVIQEGHGLARATAEQSNRYIVISDDEEIPDDSISIPDQDHLDTEVAKLLAVRKSPNKIDLICTSPPKHRLQQTLF